MWSSIFWKMAYLKSVSFRTLEASKNDGYRIAWYPNISRCLQASQQNSRRSAAPTLPRGRSLVGEGEGASFRRRDGWSGAPGRAPEDNGRRYDMLLFDTHCFLRSRVRKHAYFKNVIFKKIEEQVSFDISYYIFHWMIQYILKKKNQKYNTSTIL